MVFPNDEQRPVLMRLRPSDSEPSSTSVMERTGTSRLGLSGYSVGVIPNVLLREETARARSGSIRSLFSPYELCISPQLLSRIFPGLSLGKAAPFVAVESGGLTRMGENLHYTTPAALNRAYSSSLQDKDTSQYLRSPERLANFVYADRIGNGNEASGDGWRYRGRGLIQLTGRENYARFMKDTSVDAVSDPDLLEQPSMAVLSACWYWGWKSLNSLADAASFQSLTERINVKRLHHEQRMNAMWHAQDCLRHELASPAW
jgi:predicted chitinase